ncbi:MAG: hypothetical protein WCO02_12780 [Bacteroidota bacterium]
MEKDEMLNDDFLAGLIRKTPLESPSDDFINNVMRGIELQPDAAVEKRPYFQWLNSAVPYVLLGVIILFILYSSDIPYLNFLAGKEYFSGLFVKIFQPFWISMKALFSSKFITYSFLIGVSAGFLFIIDKLFFRRFAA